jgi:predicted acylesterase/phospholipase RssA
MSMSIPLVWDEVIWRDDWGQYLERPMSGHTIVDGGLLSNFPIELFISGEPQVTRVMGPKQDIPVLGLLIDESLAVQPVKRGILVDINIKPDELKTVQRFKSLIDTMTGAHDKMVIEEFEQLVVRLPAAGYGTTEFDMSDERRDALVRAGKDAMAAHLNKPKESSAVPRGAKGDGPKSSVTAADRMAVKMLRP